MEKIAIIPGSFDPITLGHVDIIKRAAEIFDKVYVVSLVNAEKGGMFSPEQRFEIMQSATRGIKNVECAVCDGLTSDFMKYVGAKYIVKGIRDTTDFAYENGLAEIMRHFAEGSETVFLPATPALSYISSTYAREKIKYGCDLSDIADSETAEIIRKNYNK